MYTDDTTLRVIRGLGGQRATGTGQGATGHPEPGTGQRATGTGQRATRNPETSNGQRAAGNGSATPRQATNSRPESQFRIENAGFGRTFSSVAAAMPILYVPTAVLQ